MNTTKLSPSHIVTVLLHDYFHHGVFQTVIGEKQWHRLDSRLEKNVKDACTLLKRFNIKATFFTLGWIADKYPEIIKRLVSEGHEIANAGYRAYSVRQMTPNQFKEDIQRAKNALERAGSNKIIGYRSAYQWFRQEEFWALDILIEEGYRYDSSYRPHFNSLKEKSHYRFVHTYEGNSGKILEFPASTVKILGLNLPIGGGGYFRQFPHFFMFQNFEKWCGETNMPFILYFLPWELDSNQPVVTALGPLARIRRYRNAGKMAWILPRYFREGEFQSISHYLKIPLEYPHKDIGSSMDKMIVSEAMNQTHDEAYSLHSAKAVTVIIPCYNELSSIQYLSKALNELIRGARQRYDLKFIFIDDSSFDGTYERLQAVFGDRKDCKIIYHKRNMGTAGSIKTGLQAADSEIVCSIDADCSYDPISLLMMIPMLEYGVDIVTASPYHRDGFVLGVPRWRLFLSKSLSKIYHMFLRHKLSTYTSCFRVYRRNSVLGLKNKYGDFRGIIELLAMADIHGLTIKEYPTTLQCRIYGHSKMKIFKSIVGHLKLLFEIAIYIRNYPRKY
jgi:polysaccharide deacetylase family protein (PEP-CTERM system associated)